MPIYKYKGDVYNIPDNLAAEFESRYGDATIDLWVGSDQYEIPISEKKDFLSVFSNASTERTFDGFSLPKLDTSGAILANDAGNSDFVNGKAKFPEKTLPQSTTTNGEKKGVITIGTPIRDGINANDVVAGTNAMLSANENLFKPQSQEQMKSAFVRGTTGEQLGFGGRFTSYSGREYRDKQSADMASAMERKHEREYSEQSVAAQDAAEEKALTGLFEGLEQGTEQGIAGLQYLEGEYAKEVGGSQEESLRLLAKIYEAEKAGVPEEEILKELRRSYDATKKMVETNGNRSNNSVALLRLGSILGIAPDGAKVVRDYDRYKAMGIDTADLASVKKYLKKESGIKKYSDVQREKAAETFAKAKPTEGWAWFGNLLPQMVPTAVGIAATAATKSPQVAKMTARIGMAALSGSAAGQTMYEARQAGASDGEVWAAGGAAFLTEYLTEKLPMDRYLGRLVGKVSGDVVLNPAVAKTVREAVQRIKTKSGAALTFSNEGAMAELNKLVKKANKALGGKLLGKKNIDDFLTDILAEGGSEFAAEFTQTFIPMIYEDPENYPNLVQALANGVEGAKAGVVMGGMLGGASKTLEHRQQRSRRKQQGYVDVTEIANEDGTTDVAEVLGATDDGKVVVLRDGATETIERERLGEVIRYGFDEFDSGHIIYNIEESRMVGESIKDAAAKADANNMLSIQEEKVRAMLGLDADADVAEAVGDPVAMVRKMMVEGKSDAEVQTILDYANAAAVVDGMVQRVRDDIDSRIAESDAAIDMTANTNGRVVAATTNKGEKVYVVVGNVVNNEHGNIDTTNSDQSIVVYNQATGKREMMDSKGLAAIDSDTDIEELKTTAADAIREEMATAAAGEIDGVLPMNAGDVYTLLDENGMEHQAQIVGPAEDGSIVVNLDGQQATMAAEDIQAQNKAYNMQRAQMVADAAEQVRRAENVYNAMDEVMVRNDEGNVVAATITDYNADEDAYTLQLSEGTIDGAAAPKMGRAKMDARVESVNGEYIGEAVVPEVQGNTDDAFTEIKEIEPIPTEKVDGKEVTAYHRVPIDRTMADLHDGSLDFNEIDEFIDANIAESQKAVDAIAKKKPAMSTNKAAYLAEKAKWESAMMDAQAKLNYWNAVKSEENRIREIPQQEISEEDMQSASIEETIASMFGGDGIKITPESYRKETGASTTEQRSMTGVIASAKNGGVSIERAAEIIFESGALQELGFRGDETDIRNMVIDIFREGNPRGYKARTKKASSTSPINEEDMYHLERVADELNMTPEEYLAYREQSLPGIIEAYGGLDEQSFYANLAEHYEKQEEYDTTRKNTEAAASSTILPREQSVHSEGTGNTQSGQQGGTVQTGVRSANENGTQREVTDIQQSEEVDEYGNHFVLASNGSSEFGIVDAESGLKHAPIKLSMGENTIDENGNNHGYGLLHIEAQRGEDIRNAGYSSVQEFVESVARNYTDIREGGIIANNQTYLLELVDEHNNTLFIQLSKNGEYWTINSAGIFRKKYSRNKREIYNRPALSPDTNTDTSGVDSGRTDGVTTPAGNSPQTSTDKDTDISETPQSLNEKVSEAKAETDTTPTEGQAAVPSEAEQKREAILAKVKEWEEKTGVKVEVVERPSQVKNKAVRAAIAAGETVKGWYGNKTKKVFIYLPNMESVDDVTETFVHEVVAHKGLNALLGEKAYKDLCLRVYEKMLTDEQRAQWLDYVGYVPTDAEGKRVLPTQAQKAAAADEYIASLAERTDVEAESLWGKFVDMVREFLAKQGFGLKMSDDALKSLLRQSYRNLHGKAVESASSEAVTDEQSSLRFIGEKGAANLDKAEEATTRLDNLNVAREMESAGKDALAIKMATGWERGADGKWRYETEDNLVFDTLEEQRKKAWDTYNKLGNKHDRLQNSIPERMPKGATEEQKQRIKDARKSLAKLRGEMNAARDAFYKLDGSNITTLGEFLGEDNTLFQEYPELKDMVLSFARDPKMLNNGYKGAYIPENKSIWVNGSRSKDEIRSTLGHEIQHAIQHIEGFAKGGNSLMENPVLAKKKASTVEEIDRLIEEARQEGRGYYDELYAVEDGVNEWLEQHPNATTEEDDAHRENVNQQIQKIRQKINKVDDLLTYLYERRNEVEERDIKLGYDGYKKIAGEVEARNVSKRMDYTPERRRAELASKTEDVAREDQIFIYDALESAMGNRVNKRMAEIAGHFDGAELSDTQRAIVDVFGGKENNLPISVMTHDGNARRVVMRQGTENKAGAKHSLFRHYGTNSGAYTADELLLIEDVLVNGERTEEQRRGQTVNVYKHSVDGVEYTVLTENKRNREEFANFYTNRSGDALTSNTQLSARDGSMTASVSKGTDNSANEQGDEAVSLSKKKKSLVGLHNISEDKLEKAIKQGGLANPSFAVVDIDVQGHEGYGDITLVMPSSLVDGADVYTGDAWSPTYPPISLRVDESGWGVIDKRLGEIEDDTLRRFIRSSVRNYLDDGGNARLEYVFLKEKGHEAPIEYKAAKGMIGIRGLEVDLGVSDLLQGETSYEAYLAAKPAAKRSFNMWRLVNGNAAERKKLIAQIRENRSLNEELGLTEDLAFGDFDLFVQQIKAAQDAEGSVDEFGTTRVASEKVDALGLREEYEAWLSELMEDAGAEEVFFSGFDRDGSSKYLPNTLENVSRHMRTQGMVNAYDNGGLSATRSHLLKRMNTLAAIRKNKDLLKGREKYDEVFKEMEHKLFMVISQLADMQEISSNKFMNIDYAEARLQEAITKRNPISYLNSEYGYQIAKDGEFAQSLSEFIQEVKSMPSKYFEGKFERPVYLNEFAGAVVPKGTSKEIVDALEGSGLAVMEYERGDEVSRNKAIEELAEEVKEQVMFSRKGVSQAEIEAVNERFNNALDSFSEENADSIVFDLGTPSDVLQAAGVVGKPMKLYGSKVAKKMRRHGFSVSELRDLPRAISNPIAVFNNYNEKGNRSILTELRTEQGNFLVTLSIGKGQDVDFNIVSSVFGKGDNNIINWLNNGYATYINKEKALNYLHLATPIVAASDNQELVSATKVVESFENPQISEEENEDSIRFSIERRVSPIEGYSYEEVIDIVGAEVDEVLSDYEFDNVEVVELWPNGSRMRGTAREDSDLDVVLFYKGNEKEDSMFNAIHETDISVGGIKIDVNPIQIESEADIVKYKLKSNRFDEEVLQQRLAAAEQKVANAKGVVELADAIAERERIKNETVRFSRGGAPRSSLRNEYDLKVGRGEKPSGFFNRLKNGVERFIEGYQDSMRALKILQDLVSDATGKRVETHEDAYMAENRMSSMNKTQQEAYERDFLKPMQAEIKKLLKAGAEYDAIVEYLFSKHGLERNEVFAKRNAEKQAREEYADDLEKAQKELDKDPLDPDKQDRVDQLRDAIQKRSEELYFEYLRDYSGLTALTGSETDYKAIAEQMVTDFEARYETDALWDSINDATYKSLRTEYDAGLMSKETFDYVSTMFKHYIPLRGWSEDVAGNEYLYVDSGKPRMTSRPKKATGRKSLADDPIATIAHMGGNSIVRANRNKMKQHFLNFALNHPTELLTVTEQWYVYNPITKQWERSTPDIPIDATGDEVADIVRQHEADMKALGAQAKKEKGGEQIGMHVTKPQLKEHEVRVMQGGKEYVIYVNGDPRAAQALNGLTNPHVNEGTLNKIVRGFNNFMAQAFTSSNPAFILENLRRDIMWAGTAIAVKENAKYTAKYSANVAEIYAKAMLPRLIKKWENGKLDLTNPTERYFDEFMRNGGETGFTQLNTVNQYKKDIARFVRQAKGGPMSIASKANLFRYAKQGVEFLNRSAEDTSRFAVYMTSREMGRDVARSIYDAKEITVNFNKKGSGGSGAELFTGCYVFFNAAVQSLRNALSLWSNNKVKATGAMLSYGAMGMALPLLNMLVMSMCGDDDEAYWDLPEWTRRNNLVFYCPWSENGFFVWPLPHEIRPIYGMSESLFSLAMGKSSKEDTFVSIANSFSSLLPMDFTGNGGNLAVNLTPTAFQPIIQLLVNKDYFGKPIYKDSKSLKYEPEHMKAYKSAAPLLVDMSEWLNEATGGNDVRRGAISINPDAAEHLIGGYFGGAGKFVVNTYKTISMIWDEDMRELRNVPIVNKMYVESSEERTAGSHVNKVYFDANEEAEETDRLLKGYTKRASVVEYAEELAALKQDKKRLARAELMREAGRYEEQISRALKEAELNEDKDQIDTLSQRRRDMRNNVVRRIEEINASK